MGYVLRYDIRVAVGRCWRTVRERNEPFLQPNELGVNSFLWSMWVMELSMGLRRKIGAGPREDK